MKGWIPRLNREAFGFRRNLMDGIRTMSVSGRTAEPAFHIHKNFFFTLLSPLHLT
jgi:hypothetical protein